MGLRVRVYIAQTEAESLRRALQGLPCKVPFSKYLEIQMLDAV